MCVRPHRTRPWSILIPEFLEPFPNNRLYLSNITQLHPSTQSSVPHLQRIGIPNTSLLLRTQIEPFPTRRLRLARGGEHTSSESLKNCVIKPKHTTGGALLTLGGVWYNRYISKGPFRNHAFGLRVRLHLIGTRIKRTSCCGALAQAEANALIS